MSPSSNQRREQLRTLYGFDFPDDLFRFWEFANRLQPLDPLGALWGPLQIRLVGPFEVLSGRFDRHTPRLSPLLHWRYYLDPPEFFTVLAGDTDRLHWGYYLDDPPDGARCVASYYGNDVFELAADGDHLFQAVRLQLESNYWTETQDAEADTKYADEHKDRLRLLSEFRPRLLQWATADRLEIGSGYVEKYQTKVARNAAIVADVNAALDRGRNCLVLTQRVEHLGHLAHLLSGGGHVPYVLQGGMGKKARTAVADGIAGHPEDSPILILATGPYAGEGFDCPRLDTVFLALPISSRTKITQYIGRTMRDHESKSSVEVHDYDDKLLPIFRRGRSVRVSVLAGLGFDVRGPSGAPR